MAVKAHNAAQDLKMKDERPDFHLMLASMIDWNGAGSHSTLSIETTIIRNSYRIIIHSVLIPKSFSTKLSKHSNNETSCNNLEKRILTIC